MLKPIKGPSTEITGFERKNDELYLTSEYAIHRLRWIDEKTLRVTMTKEEKFSDQKRPGIVNDDIYAEWSMQAGEKEIVMSTKSMKVTIDMTTGAISYHEINGNLLFAEAGEEAKKLDKFDTYMLSGENAVTEKIETPDGIKEIVKEASKVHTGSCYHAFLRFQRNHEAFYGLGQHEEGYGSLNGHVIYMHQANRKSTVPLLMSTKGYGILVDAYCPMIFNDTMDLPYFYMEAVDEIDYYFCYGGSMDKVISTYRKLTGKAAMLPKWAFGFIQSKERYETAEEIIRCLDENRNRGIGVDCMVLDWMSWEGGKWGQKTYDKSRFPDAKKMISDIHDRNAHFMISLWPTAGGECEDHAEFAKEGVLLKESDLYNPLDPKGREVYWRQIEREHWPAGTDAWWCDSSEPITVEWSSKEFMEPSKVYEEFYRQMSLRIPAQYSNAYCLYHAMSIYDGQRAEMEKESKEDASYKEKRVVNLTRSGMTGQQRLGCIMWSGDIDAKWKTLREQIGTGLNFCASGIPYWTIDIGAFFVGKGEFWYWQGEFENPETNLGYRELYARWYQWAVFLPIFRAHGTEINREAWNFGQPGEMFYDAMLAANRLRYSLIPYIYSQAGKTWLFDESMMRPLSFDWPEDEKVWNVTDQYMFGDALMVAPITEPMYYDHLGNEMTNPKRSRKIYLPKGTWYDFYTKEKYEGGQVIEIDVTIEKIPVFVKNGSIIPMCEPALSTSELSTEPEFKVYSDCDCEYVYYEDAGDGYGYEKGEYTLKRIVWDETAKKITQSVLTQAD